MQVKVAVAQFSAGMSKPANLESITRLAAQAADAGARLVVFPEGAMCDFGAKTDDPVQMYLNDIFTIPAPLAGLPAMSIPCGFDAAGLPIGLQLQGPHFSEAKLLGVAARYQQATDWHRRVPGETPL